MRRQMGSQWLLEVFINISILGGRRSLIEALSDTANPVTPILRISMGLKIKRNGEN